jgi:hypothetical protein
MQSLSRQLKRGNAMIIFDSILKQLERIPKRGTSVKFWKSNKKNQMLEEEKNVILTSPKPIVGKVGRKKEWASPTSKRPLNIFNHTKATK